MKKWGKWKTYGKRVAAFVLTSAMVVIGMNLSPVPVYAAPEDYENGFCKNSSIGTGGTLVHTDCAVEGCCGYEPAKLTTDTYDINGDGTKDSVYEISNAGQLYWFANKVNTENSTYGSANAVLTANIKVNDSVLTSEGKLNEGSANTFRQWTPIGNWSNNYEGTFDGNNCTVSGLYFNNNSINYVGLFGYISGANIKQVGIIDSYFNGKDYVGGVCGRNARGTISGCYNTGAVSGSDYVGGVSGNGSVTNSYNAGTVTGNKYVGGVCG